MTGTDWAAAAVALALLALLAFDLLVLNRRPRK